MGVRIGSVTVDTSGRPPLGVMPHWIWVEKRINELGRAIAEYVTEGLEINPEWVTEYNNLISVCAKR